jgi:hypothetical protein
MGASLFMERGRKLRVAPHSGILGESLLFNAYFRQGWFYEQETLAPELSIGVGGRFIPTFGLPGFCVEGRPYRGERGEQQRAVVRAGRGFDWREPRAKTWAKRAADECASVPAFLQLALELLELEAPIELVRRAVAAADEELGHTRDATRLAELFGGAPVLLSPPPFRLRPALPRRRALRRLARESWHDGCVNEGMAAAVAREEAQRSRFGAEALISARIAREEAGHAALSRDVLRWLEPA